MFIKQVIIEGFKSYKEQVATEPFSPKHNCVVGANGSGKTNFFHAIRFVLSDLFHNLRAEDRQALLHEGAGHQVLAAFVEIVFDNSDNRIPVDREEVRLRRTIGLKKDEYFLDKKHITKTEVMNLLESAGFSRSNPYYVVQQGKIASLTLMKDSERLDLLKEIGGTRVYEERRKESLKIMQETENKRKQIIEVVQYIEERLRELDEEKEELKKYQTLDKDRRSLEYTIYEKELQDAKQKLEEIEEARAKVSEKSTSMYYSVLEAHERFKTLEKDLKSVSKEAQGMTKEKDAAEKRKTETMKRHAKLELDVRDLEERISGEGRMKEDVAKELKNLEKEIQKSRKELEKVRPLHDQQLLEEEEITRGIMDREKQLSILYQKQGRATQFSSKAARDKWLQKEIDDLQRVLSSTMAQEQKLREEIEQLNQEFEEQERSIEARSVELKGQESDISQCQGEFASLKVERDGLQETRKKLWKQENELASEIDKLKSEIAKAEKSLDHAAPGVAETRFASHTIVLRRLVRVKEALCQMVISNKWGGWKQVDTEKAKIVKDLIFSDDFWNRVEYALELTEPLMSMLRYADTDEPCLGNIYDAMDSMLERMKSVIQRREQDPDTLYSTVEKIVLHRWNKMTTPLHLLAYALSPRYYSSEILDIPGKVPPYRDPEVAAGYKRALNRLFSDPDVASNVRREFVDFVSGKFAEPDAINDQSRLDAIGWWYLHGERYMYLQPLAIKILSQDIRRGLNSIRRICRDHSIPGVFGPICELLDCDEKFFTAVEVTAGNSLFHVVVESDEISTRIIRYLTAEKGGRVTFMPLNRVRAPQVKIPHNPDIVPLLKKLKFSSRFAPAFSQIFGRTVICRDLEVATKVARTDSLDCITLEGDQVSKKGGMTGGFYDYRRSKLKLMNIIRQNTKAINSKQDELAKVRTSVQDQRITTIVSDQQKMDAKRGHHKSELEQLKQDIANATKQRTSISKALEKKKKLLATARNQIDQLKAGMAMKRAEMGTDLIDQLTPDEKALLSRLNPEITQLKEKHLMCMRARIETETRRSELETNLSTNLVRAKQELEAQLAVADSESLSTELQLKRQELQDAQASVDDATEQLKAITDQIDKYAKQIKEMKNGKDELKALEDNYERTLQDEAKDLEQLLNKRNLLQGKREESMKKIRDLGSLPSDAFEKNKRKNLKELHKLLHKCNESLKKFSHVNKKALDQYVSFTEQREELHKRQAELDAGDEKIRELISVLDQRKDESIERTFKGVAKNFREAFSELVPGGHGSLVMKKKKAGEVDEDDPDDDGNRDMDSDARVEKYIGVKVKVSFTGKGETQLMKQLSGGQKTVVALTLIFAIQRCDPAPFYLFDEIDAALDPQYRTAVGNMIKRQADTASTQFITTTFRPELVKVADKIYGVTHKNRVSRVDVITREDALYFIERDQSHQQE